MFICKFFALVALLGLVALSGWATHSLLTVTHTDGMQFGLWVLLVLHLFAACILTGAFLNIDE